MKIVAAGLSGLIGRPLKGRLIQKNELVLLKRKNSTDTSQGTLRQVLWDPPQIGEWAKEVDGADAVINLSGEPIAEKRWTAAQKKELKNSRLNTTRAIVDAILRAKNKPKVLLNASAIGFYGPRNHSALDEGAEAGEGFLAEMCQEWESEARRAESSGVRVVRLRTGIVLAKEGGALAKMAPPFRFFLGGPLGGGQQMMSWIHIEDEVGAMIKILEDPNIHGAVNLTAPQPVTMREFARALGKTLNRPALFPVPAFALKILLGEMSEMLLTGQNVYPKKLLEAGFKFKYPSLDPALKSLLT